jgi:hypothetical protein
MLKKKCFGLMLLAAAAVSSTAMAQDRGANTIVGALAGGAIGGAVGGRNGAIVGGVLGAAVGNSVRTNDDYYYRDRGGYVQQGYSSGYYQAAPVYVEPQPVYAAAPAYYYDSGPEVVVVGGGRYYGGRDRYYDRGYYDRGHDRGRDHGDRGGWHR